MAAQVPASLKAISSYLKTAQEYDKRDPVVAYYCKSNFMFFFGVAKYNCTSIYMREKSMLHTCKLKSYSCL